MNEKIAALIKEQSRLESLQDDLGDGEPMSEQDQVQYGKLAVRIRACEKEILAEDRRRFDKANRGGDFQYRPMENSLDDRYRAMRAGGQVDYCNNLSTVGSGGWIDSRGKKVNVLSNTQKLADRYEHLLPDGLRLSDLSAGRYLRAMSLGNWDGAGAEFQICAAAGSTTSNPNAAYLVPNPLSALVVDLARSRSVVFQAGAEVLEMDSSDLTVAKLTGDPTASIKGENVAFSESEPTFSAATLVAKTLGIYYLFSKELWMDAPNIGDIIQNTLTKALGTELDRQIISGSASQELVGIDLYAGTNSIGSVGSPEWDDILNAIKMNMLDNQYGMTAAIYSPQCWYDLQAQKTGDGTNSAKNYLLPTAPVAQLRHLVTTSMPDGNAIVGDFRQCWLVLGRRSLSMFLTLRTQLSRNIRLRLGVF